MLSCEPAATHAGTHKVAKAEEINAHHTVKENGKSMKSPKRFQRNPHYNQSRFGKKAVDEALILYGIHTVAAALANENRTAIRLQATENALTRLAEEVDLGDVPVETVSAQSLSKSLPADAVHQGAALEVEPLEPLPINDLGLARFIVALDQVTDPHNVGAIMRSAVAFGADAILTPWRHSPKESAVLAKSASGAVDLLSHIQVSNLGKGLTILKDQGFQAIGMDSEGAEPFSQLTISDKVVLVLGAEGKGLRQGVRATCDTIARIELPGSLKSLNVSNAAAIALYAVTESQKRSD